MTIKQIDITRHDVEQYKRDFLDNTMAVSVTTAAKCLEVNPRTVQNYLREGKIPCYNLGQGRTKGDRILAADLREFMRSCRVDKRLEG